MTRSGAPCTVAPMPETFQDLNGITRLGGTLQGDGTSSFDDVDIADDLTVGGDATVTGAVQGATVVATTGVTTVGLTVTGNSAIGNAGSDTIGFYGQAATAQQTGVAVTAAGIHAALVALGLITA